MVDERSALLDVALAVARLRVVLADQLAQRARTSSSEDVGRIPSASYSVAFMSGAGRPSIMQWSVIRPMEKARSAPRVELRRFRRTNVGGEDVAAPAETNGPRRAVWYVAAHPAGARAGIAGTGLAAALWSSFRGSAPTCRSARAIVELGAADVALRLTSIEASSGEYVWNVRSTPSPLLILRTVNDELSRGCACRSPRPRRPVRACARLRRR